MATTRGSLKKHERVRYPCAECEYVATTRGSLKKHERVRYPCDECENIATDAGNLTQHVQGKNEVVRYFNYCENMATNEKI